ncbi:MAG: hypothetical protein JST05_01170 [Acidobacteria bacterium]|nr:hypothetical protein [Acidobacteriota bacterium]
MAAITATRRLRNAESAAVRALREIRVALQESGPDEVFDPDPWGDEGLEDLELEEDWGPDEDEPGLDGLGNFFKKVAHAISKIASAPVRLISKKAADNMEKLDNKVIEAADKVWTASGDLLHKVGNKIAKALGKNWKWIAIIVAIAITIYSMGAGATIAAHLISGMEALGHAIAAGAAAVGHAVVSAGTALAHAVGFGSGAAVATTGTTVAATSSSTWLATAGKLAMTAASALTQRKAKISDLSQAQAMAMVQAHDQGYNMGLEDPQMQDAILKRASIPGVGIPTDANGNPLVNPSQVGAGVLLPDGSVVPFDSPEGRSAAAQGAQITAAPVGGFGSGGGAGSGPSGMPGWILPAAIGGGLLAFAFARK